MSSNESLADASSLVFAARSTLVREEVWLELSQIAFDIALDGFVRVRGKVSAEGRAAMIKDVTALEEGLTTVHPCRAPRSREYVTALLSAASLADDEFIAWLRSNFPAYAYRHLHGLASQVFSSSLVSLNSNSSKRLKEAIALLDDVYDVADEKKEGGKLTAQLQTMLQHGKVLLETQHQPHHPELGGGGAKLSAMLTKAIGGKK